jgi:hypothetical protein
MSDRDESLRDLEAELAQSARDHAEMAARRAGGNAMDPNTALLTLREAVRDYFANGRDAVMLDDLAEHFDALDGWLSHGGFLPAAWNRPLTSEAVDAAIRSGEISPFRSSGPS